jgi:hypothetical protein
MNQKKQRLETATQLHKYMTFWEAPLKLLALAQRIIPQTILAASAANECWRSLVAPVGFCRWVPV